MRIRSTRVGAEVDRVEVEVVALVTVEVAMELEVMNLEWEVRAVQVEVTIFTPRLRVCRVRASSLKVKPTVHPV